MQHLPRLRIARALRLRTALALGLAPSAGACAEAPESTDVRLDFERTIPAYDAIEVDSGLVEVTEGVSLRTVTTFEAAWSFAASGIARGSFVEPIDDTGSISVGGTATIDLYAEVTLPGQEFAGFVGTKTLEFETDVARFDPFLVGEPMIFGLDIPAELEVRFDPITGTGLAFVVEFGLGLAPTYEGKCLDIDEARGIAQYTMELQPIGDLEYLYAVELVSPLGGTRLGALGIDLELSGIYGAEVDLGTLSVEDGEPAGEPGPCAG